MRHGIEYHPERQQPYTVWAYGYAEYFTGDLETAQAKFAKLREDRRRRAQPLCERCGGNPKSNHHREACFSLP